MTRKATPPQVPLPSSANASIAPEKVYELGGEFSITCAGGGYVFVGNQNEPTIDRLKGVDREIEKHGSLNLSAFGVTSAVRGSDELIHIISPDLRRSHSSGTEFHRTTLSF